MDKILRDHLRRYPQMQVADLYKLLHQAALGSEHAMSDKQSAWSWLERELAEMGDGPNEPLLDLISPDGQIVRIHLRPYVRAGNQPEALLTAFFRTANEFCGSAETLQDYKRVAEQLTETENWPVRRVEIETFFAKMEKMDFPAVHHSGIYTDLYRPAYRVVAKRLLEEV